MRPTAPCTSATFHGALKNWVRLQDEHPCFFFVADWHALTTHYETPQDIEASVWDMLVDWFAAGIDPAKATVFIQSRVPEHAELFLLLAMATPLGWLERVPTYKDQIGKAEGARPVDLRLPRLPVDAGGRHPDLPRQHGAGRRGPGAAHRDDARDRPPLQPPVGKEPGFEEKGQRGGEEARRQARQRRTWNCATATRRRVISRRSRRAAPCWRPRPACRPPIASGCSATLRERAASSSPSPRRSSPRRRSCRDWTVRRCRRAMATRC